MSRRGSRALAVAALTIATASATIVPTSAIPALPHITAHVGAAPAVAVRILAILTAGGNGAGGHPERAGFAFSVDIAVVLVVAALPHMNRRGVSQVGPPFDPAGTNAAVRITGRHT